MKIAIIYTSKYGTTEKVAQKIAKQLKPHQVSLINLKKDKNPNIKSFDGVILGSSIYVGKPRKAMRSFLEKYTNVLTEKHLGLFVCGTEDDAQDSKYQYQELYNAYPEILLEQAVAMDFLGGEFLLDKMNFFERYVVKKADGITESVFNIREDRIKTLAAIFLESLI